MRAREYPLSVFCSFVRLVPSGVRSAVAAATALHQQYLIRHRDPEDCFRAFLNNNLFGLAVFGGILLDYLFA